MPGVPGDENRLRIFIVFGLREQIHCQPVGIGPAVGNDQDLGGAGDHVDAHLPEYRALGRRHIDIARPDDLVDPRNAPSAISQRRHGLGTAQREYPVDPGKMRRSQHQFVDDAIRRRHDHDDFAHTGHVRRHGIHQYRRGIGGLAAGYVDTDPIERRHLLAQHGAIRLAVLPGFRLLALVIEPDALGGMTQRLALFRRHALECRLETFRADHQLGHVGSGQTVEAVGVLDHGVVTALANGGDDLRDPPPDLMVGDTFPGQQ